MGDRNFEVLVSLLKVHTHTHTHVNLLNYKVHTHAHTQKSQLVLVLGGPLEKGIANYFSILALRTP